VRALKKTRTPLRLSVESTLLTRYRVAVDNLLKTTFWEIPEENYPQG
jgi:hypothetical protein